MTDEEYCRFHRIRQAADAAAEPYLRLIREIYDHALNPLVIRQKDGSISVIHEPLPEKPTIEELHKKCQQAVDEAVARAKERK
jgi:hypothetical protein